MKSIARILAGAGIVAMVGVAASPAFSQTARGRPSWTLRAPGHEGVRCWYVATGTTVHDHRSEKVEPPLFGLY
jgi:hypothetical protein